MSNTPSNARRDAITANIKLSNEERNIMTTGTVLTTMTTHLETARAALVANGARSFEWRQKWKP